MALNLFDWVVLLITLDNEGQQFIETARQAGFIVNLFSVRKINGFYLMVILGDTGEFCRPNQSNRDYFNGDLSGSG